MNNKEIVQSYISVMARYSSNLYEERLIIKVAEFLQRHLDGERLVGAIKVDTKKPLILKTSIKELCSDDIKDVNYNYIFNALKGISEKSIGRAAVDKKGKDVVIYIPISVEAGVVIESGEISIEINPRLVDFMLDFSKGYRKYELIYPFKMKSAYSIRLYKMIANQNNKLNFNLSNFKEMIGARNKYSNIKDFRNLLDRIKKEFIKVNSPYIFDYEIDGKTNIISLIPIKNDEAAVDEVIEKNRCESVGMKAYIGDAMWELLRDAKFSVLLLTRNRQLIQQFHDVPHSLGILHQLIMEHNEKPTFKYIILREMKKEVEKSNKKLVLDSISKTVEDSYFYDGMEYV